MHSDGWLGKGERDLVPLDDVAAGNGALVLVVRGPGSRENVPSACRCRGEGDVLFPVTAVLAARLEVGHRVGHHVGARRYLAAALVGEGRRQDPVNRRRGRRVARDPASVRHPGRVRLRAGSRQRPDLPFHGGRGRAGRGCRGRAPGQRAELGGRGPVEHDALLAELGELQGLAGRQLARMPPGIGDGLLHRRLIRRAQRGPRLRAGDQRLELREDRVRRQVGRCVLVGVLRYVKRGGLHGGDRSRPQLGVHLVGCQSLDRTGTQRGDQRRGLRVVDDADLLPGELRPG